MGRRRAVGDYFRALMLVCLMALWLAPSLFMIGNSFGPTASFSRDPPAILPDRLTLAHYQWIFSLPMLPRWILNTLIVATLQVTLSIMINGMAGYVFMMSKSRWAKYLFWLFMAPMFVSGFILIVPQFVIVGKLGLLGLPAVVLMSLFWPTGIYLFRNYFKSIPVGLIESARLDGASDMAIFGRVALPLSGPIVGMSAVILGMGSIQAFLWPYLNLRRPEQQTYLVGLMLNAINVYATKNIGRDLAIGCMAFLPYFIIFVLSRKYFIGGALAGAIKE